MEHFPTDLQTYQRFLCPCYEGCKSNSYALPCISTPTSRQKNRRVQQHIPTTNRSVRVKVRAELVCKRSYTAEEQDKHLSPQVCSATAVQIYSMFLQQQPKTTPLPQAKPQPVWHGLQPCFGVRTAGGEAPPTQTELRKASLGPSACPMRQLSHQRGPSSPSHAVVSMAHPGNGEVPKTLSRRGQTPPKPQQMNGGSTAVSVQDLPRGHTADPPLPAKPQAMLLLPNSAVSNTTDPPAAAPGTATGDTTDP